MWCKSTIEVDKKLADNVYLIHCKEKKSHPYVMKIVDPAFHPFSRLKSFNDEFPTKSALSHRMHANYNFASSSKLGPKLFDSFLCNENLVIITEYLPTKFESSMIDQYQSKIQSMIKKLHDDGIIHGDLHGGNIMIDAHGNPKIVDWDTTFLFDEYKNTALYKEWVSGGFGMDTLQELIDHEYESNWKIVPDDDESSEDDELFDDDESA